MCPSPAPPPPQSTHTVSQLPPPSAGVYLKANAEAVAALGLPAPEHDLGLRFVETQLAAVPEDPGGWRVQGSGFGRWGEFCWSGIVRVAGLYPRDGGASAVRRTAGCGVAVSTCI